MSHRRGQNHCGVTLTWLGAGTCGWQEIAGTYVMESSPAGLACALSHPAKRRGRRRGVRRRDGLALLEDGQDVSGRVLEPGDVRAAGPVDAVGVLAHAVVPVQGDAAADQILHCRGDACHPEGE